MQQGARPAGLYAQTSMRIKKRYLSMWHDLDEDVSPLEAGLAFAVAWDRDFIGREALLARQAVPLTSRTMSLILEDPSAVPLGSEPVCLGKEIAGQTTSAAFGYCIGRPLVLAYLPPDIERGTSVSIDIAGEHFTALVRSGVAYDPSGTRMKKLV